MRPSRASGRLEEAGRGHFDSAADISRIRALLDQGCYLEADIVPTVARTCPLAQRGLGALPDAVAVELGIIAQTVAEVGSG